MMRSKSNESIGGVLERVHSGGVSIKGALAMGMTFSDSDAGIHVNFLVDNGQTYVLSYGNGLLQVGNGLLKERDVGFKGDSLVYLEPFFNPIVVPSIEVCSQVSVHHYRIISNEILGLMV